MPNSLVIFHKHLFNHFNLGKLTFFACISIDFMISRKKLIFNLSIQSVIEKSCKLIFLLIDVDATIFNNLHVGNHIKMLCEFGGKSMKFLRK